ncbi:prolyl oligopeptidase family serine peptidase [Streptomyces hebeiensis]|uniref:Prolyl oligopeptidase family serine peptidase n=1 Tax=Streptomyces hebeiensis TaxID=229486 RepID=A0ABP4FHV6_9ACTN
METTAFPRQFARTRRFSLGAPRRFTVSPDGDRVLFLRSASGSDPRALLWLYEHGTERLLAGGTADAEEKGAGIGGYAADRDVRLVAYTVDGALELVRTDGGAPWRVPTPGPVTDPRPSPDGDHVAYVTGGALRIVRADGSDDRPLAVPETPDVTYGLPDHVAVESIGRTRAFWWSPDGTALLVARVDTSKVRRWYLGDPSDPAAPPRTIRYPAAGTANAETSLHILRLTGGRTPVRLPRQASGTPAGPGSPGPDAVWRDPAFDYVVAADWDAFGPLISLQTRDQRTVWVVGADPTTGEAGLLVRRTDPYWVAVPCGAPLRTATGTPVLPGVRGDDPTLWIGDTPAPAGTEVRAVLGAVGERVFFEAMAVDEPTETHVWSYAPGHGFERLTSAPGVHTAAVGGDTVVLDSRTPDGQTVTVVRGGTETGRIEVLTEEPLVTPRPVPLVLGDRRLRAQLHLPSWHEPGAGRLPVLLSPYAGPGMQVVTEARAWHTAVRQWFAEQGFAVLVTDGRGTPGRGLEWQRAIAGDRLTPVLTDQVDALHAAAAHHPDLDLDRVAIRGWSFSGYLAAAAVLHRPDVFHAAVAGAPPTDRRMYDTYWEERFLGHPGITPEAYERSSLLSHAHRLTRPLLLVHGLADDNVVPAHTLRLSAALLAAGRPHTVLPLPGTGHLVARPGVADTLLLRELDFLEKALAPERSGAAPRTP